MPASSFFRNLGLFVHGDFFDPATCILVQSEMCAADSEKALITGENPEGGRPGRK